MEGVVFLIFSLLALSHFLVYFYTTDLDKNNTKIKSELNKCTTELYLTYGDQIGETKKVKKNKTYICICKYCLQPFLAKIKHLIKENLTSHVF